jgi:hypothetical protein
MELYHSRMSVCSQKVRFLSSGESHAITLLPQASPVGLLYFRTVVI